MPIWREIWCRLYGHLRRAQSDQISRLEEKSQKSVCRQDVSRQDVGRLDVSRLNVVVYIIVWRPVVCSVVDKKSVDKNCRGTVYENFLKFGIYVL